MPRISKWLLPLLVAATITLTALSVHKQHASRASLLEAGAVVSGAICVWLTVRASLWNFPFSLLSVILFAVIFFETRLLGDAGLQVVYFVLTISGWIQWLYGGDRRTRLPITRATRVEMTLVLGSVTALTLALWPILAHFNGDVTFFDALATSISLGAQWLLNRKKVQSWWFWITADIIYVPLYLYKSLHLTGYLYAVFLVMAVTGLFEWRAKLRQASSTVPADQPVEAAA